MEATELCRMLEEQYFGPDMHEREELDLLPGLLKGVSLFADIGASLGPYSYHTNKVLRNSRIVCVEADPVRAHRLQELTQEWTKTSGNQFKVVQAAAADKPGKMEFHLTDKNISGALFQHFVPDPELRASINWRKTEVEVITLDELFREGDPDLIKIDVEGAEYRVLQGARGILQRGKSRFLVEVHPWGDEPIGKTPADVFNLFAQFGYDFKRTHRHWHFYKSNRPVRRYLKNRAVVFIMNHQALKAPLKKMILSASKFRRRKPGVA